MCVPVGATMTGYWKEDEGSEEYKLKFNLVFGHLPGGVIKARVEV